MTEKILFVDDEPSVLEGYKRLLGRDLSIDTAVGGPHGLTAITECGPYAVVISDMRMPQMDGAQFLARVRDIAPTTVRLALTGYVDIETAMYAVNEGSIFRFLTKPCSKENLLKAIEAALGQHRLIHAEKELLEQTLRGSVNTLSEVLSFSNPAAFGRAMRLRRIVQHIVKKLNMETTWQFEIAAILSQLGCVTLPTELIDAAYAEKRLTEEEQKKYDAHPSIAGEMLSRIPRMEAIAQMIAGQNNSNPVVEAKGLQERQEIEFGIQLLRVGLAFEKYLARGHGKEDAIIRVKASLRDVDSSILRSLEDFAPAVPMLACECAVSELSLGMILKDDLYNSNGLLLVAKGQELTFQWLERLKSFAQRRVIDRKVSVWIPQNRVN